MNQEIFLIILGSLKSIEPFAHEVELVFQISGYTCN